jgi:hypothetical protein
MLGFHMHAFRWVGGTIMLLVRAAHLWFIPRQTSYGQTIAFSAVAFGKLPSRALLVGDAVIIARGLVIPVGGRRRRRSASCC